MSQPARLRLPVAIVATVAALVSGVIVRAQIGVTPYKVNYNWDKLEGRKIGVASGIRTDPDGQHLWILDRCGANGCAESTLDPIIEVDMDGKFVRSFAVPHAFDTDKIAAAFKNGVLTVTLPKKEAAKPRQIKIELNA